MNHDKYKILGIDTLKLLIVDDDEQVLEMSKFVLEDYSYYGCSLEIIEAKSAQEAKEMFNTYNDIAIAFIDIIMEEDNAGLDLIQHIRNSKNDLTRLIIRTGQPGIYPPEEIFFKYDINDYLNKNDLSHQRLILSLTSAIRSYLDVLLLNKISSQKIAHERMLLSQSKNAAIGEMIQAITHQWSQPLTILKMSQEFVQSDFNQEQIDKDAINENLQIMQKHINYMTTTLHDFKNFFSPNKDKSFFSVEDAIENARNIISNKYITFDIQTPNNHYVYGHLNELSQVFIILFNNTCDAVKDKSKQNATVKIWSEVCDDKVYIYIHDNAGGIPDKVLLNIFAKYNTSKQYGTGIGLYLTKLILNREFNADIEAFNQDEGACFLISLPLQKHDL